MYPNASTKRSDFTFSSAFIAHCGAGGCLFRIDTDPNETRNLLSTAPNASVAKRVQRMMADLQDYNKTAFSPERGPGEADKNVVNAACKVALERYEGFFGPYVDLS